MKNGEPRIFYLPMGTLGYAKIGRNVIVLSEDVRRYPELERFVLEHEKKHLEYGLNVWKHFKLDLKDTYRMFTDPVLYPLVREISKPSMPFKQQLIFGLAELIYDLLDVYVVAVFQTILRIYINIKLRIKR
jgi:hypothetical protein